MTTIVETSLRVAGDPTVDWALVMPPGSRGAALQTTYQWESQTATRLVAQPGGAALLTQILQAANQPAGHDGGVRSSVSGVELAPELLRDPHTPRVTRIFTLWDQYPHVAGSGERVWRMHDFLGQQSATDDRDCEFEGGPWPRGCLLIDDTNLGYRRDPRRWPAFAAGDPAAPQHIVVRIANPLASGPFWEHLIERFANALTVYCTAGDLRREYAPIGQPLSWELTSSEVANAVRGRPEFAAVARVVVSLGMSGAIMIERGGSATVVFDPAFQEDDWERQHPGMPVGLGTCMSAALANECARSPENPDWLAAMRRGLVAGRSVHEHGFSVEPAGQGVLRFPVERVATVLRTEVDGSTFQCVDVPRDDQWSIFASAFPEGYRAAARQLAIQGDAEGYRGLPVERMGAWSSVDRTEIESMRSVRNIIREYIVQPRRGRPLSIAVFGPPGSGKSFAIKEMAREWIHGGTKMTVLEYNLSQFSSFDDLAAAFQCVRDCAVDESLPLVFWDEFDAAPAGRELGWLAQFLAPMQDGAFQDAGVIRPIGPGIFVFAGGTHATMSSFKERAETLPGAKASDFLSRLRGYVDILGPNPSSPTDETYLLRRTFLLRSQLRRRAQQVFNSGRLNIDPGVLRAFLEVTAYVHGARSMEAIIDMSSLTGKLRYERSALPARHQLDLHVDAEEFLSLVQQEAPV